MLYAGKPILAAFHSSSAGITAKSGDAWVSDLPYLVSVESPETAESVPNYYSVNTFTAEQFREKILAEEPEAVLEGSAKGWVTDLQKTAPAGWSLPRWEAFPSGGRGCGASWGCGRRALRWSAGRRTSPSGSQASDTGLV